MKHLRSSISIKTKLMASTIAVVGVVLCMFGVVVYQQIKIAGMEKIDVRLEGLSQKLRDELDEDAEQHRSPRAAKYERIIAKTLPQSLFVLFDSSGHALYADSLSLREPLAPVIADQKKTQYEFTTIHQQPYRTLRRIVEIDTQNHCILQVSAPLSDLIASLQELQWILWISIPAALLFIAFAVNVIVRRAFRPLTAMIQTADRISASTLDERLPLLTAEHEVASLGNSFNRMIERLEAAFKSQKQFITDASHELRTPLTIIQSELEFAGRSDLPAQAVQSMNTALEELEHLRKLAGDLLLLAKLESNSTMPEPASVRIDELLAECVQRITRLARHSSIAINLTLQDTLSIHAHEEHLRSVVMNLLENAMKFSEPGSSVDVTLFREKDSACISVRDSGTGIPEEDRPYIFQPFYRGINARAHTTGSGLGLSLVQRIVTMYNGTVHVETHQPHGTTFIIRLPLAPSSQQQS